VRGPCAPRVPGETVAVVMRSGRRRGETCNRSHRSRAQCLRVPAHAAGRPPLGTRGAAIAECARRACRPYASMIASGVPGKLRRVPVVLLFLELGVGVAASLVGLPSLLSAQPAGRATTAMTCTADRGRRRPVRHPRHQVRNLPAPGSGPTPRAGLTARLTPGPAPRSARAATPDEMIRRTVPPNCTAGPA
jgi:hypothetical protein